MTAAVESKKKKKVCKRNKKNWRKYIDTKDIDDFLDQQRQEERIGGPASKKKNEELFFIDDLPTKEAEQERNLPLTKKQRALLPMTCYKNLESLTAVPDPITKRNRVRTKEERQATMIKKKRPEGWISQRIIKARQDRQQTLKKKKAEPKRIVFRNDVWDEKPVLPDLEWLGKDALEHNLSKAKLASIRAPKGIVKKKSVLPALELPHPGTSYNPSVSDHQDLLRIVADKEIELQKKEAHLDRVTSAFFQKVTPEEKQAQWVAEMSQGLVKSEVPDHTDDVEIKEEPLSDEEDTKENFRLSINPPTDRLKAKTRKQRRIQKRLREEALQRKYAKVEKKKVSDIYALRKLNSSLDSRSEKQKLMVEKRKKLAAAHAGRTKRLAAKPFEEADIDFSRPCELRSSLNLVKKQGSLLADRYLSLQKRNILAPGTKQTKLRKAKVKRFVKASHKIDESGTQNQRRKGMKPRRK
uniref:Ribosome biogenesis protein NOP53 n=1 Tax=Lygus hesperus TaxID=30085 RepID=A0A0A9X8V0_LYGHE